MSCCSSHCNCSYPACSCGDERTLDMALLRHCDWRQIVDDNNRDNGCFDNDACRCKPFCTYCTKSNGTMNCQAPCECNCAQTAGYTVGCNDGAFSCGCKCGCNCGCGCGW